MSDPVFAEVTRGGAVESRHRGVAVLARASGVVEILGSADRPVFPRSAIKPIQALQLIESGAADRSGLGDREIALACASHSGEPMHVDLAARWLDALGLGEGALECGAHWPISEGAARALAADRRTPCALHNNCSGKHVGFLNVAQHLGERLEGYVERDHPTQARWLEALEALSGERPDPALAGIDGCAIPSQPLSLTGIAAAMSRFATYRGFDAARTAAAKRINAAMAAHPELVAGTGRMCTRIMQATSGRVLAKVGAEGVFLAWIPEAEAAVALKIEDGATRAAEISVAALVRRLLGAAHPISGLLEPLTIHPLFTAAGAPAGEVRPAPSIAAAQDPA